MKATIKDVARVTGVSFKTASRVINSEAEPSVGEELKAKVWAAIERLGHREIAFLGGEEAHASSLERLNGYRAALEHHAIPVDAAPILPGDYNFDSGADRTSGEPAVPGSSAFRPALNTRDSTGPAPL